MKKHHILILLTVAACGFAFTRLQKNAEVSVYRNVKEIPANASDSICDTVSFNAVIAPVFHESCVRCHEGISDYKSVSEYADHILKALKGEGASLMPKEADPLPASFIKKYQCWIDQGKKDN